MRARRNAPFKTKTTSPTRDPGVLKPPLRCAGAPWGARGRGTRAGRALDAKFRDFHLTNRASPRPKRADLPPVTGRERERRRRDAHYARRDISRAPHREATLRTLPHSQIDRERARARVGDTPIRAIGAGARDEKIFEMKARGTSSDPGDTLPRRYPKRSRHALDENMSNFPIACLERKRS